jgi:hypothetical protein
MARTLTDLNNDVDVLQRRLGEQEESAATIEDLEDVGLVTKASDGTVVAAVKEIGGAQALQDFVKGYQ